MENTDKCDGCQGYFCTVGCKHAPNDDEQACRDAGCEPSEACAWCDGPNTPAVLDGQYQR